MDASDVIASQIKIADWDGSLNPLETWFLYMQLAPDNKIYISTKNATEVFHVINQPDSLGIACDFVQGGLPLPKDNLTIPYFPNYDLGPLSGSPCDTVYTNLEATNTIYNFRIYPNPASWWVNIVYDLKDDASFELVDLYGRRVAAVSLFHYFKNRTLDVHELSEGVYAYTIKNKNGVLEQGKLVVVK
jgi:hypothetical protein